MRCIEDSGCIVLNSRSLGDCSGQLTYVIKNRKSTNDLAWVNLTAISEIKNFEVMQMLTGSDHFPISITLETKKK